MTSSGLDSPAPAQVDGREVTIPFDTACTLYKIAFEATGLKEHDLIARRALGKAIHAVECPGHAAKEGGEKL